jgi:AcrR family transcriptional regulator
VHARRQPAADERVDPRVVRSKQAVLEAAVELLAERGYACTTVQDVSDRSGVAKTTIYRHWPSRAALLVEAVESLIEPLRPPDTGDVRRDVVTMLGRLVRVLEEDRIGRILPSLVEGAERDPALSELAGAFVAERRQPLRRVLDLGVERGQVRPGVDTDALAVMLAGPVFYLRLVARRPIRRRFVGELVDRVLGPVCPERPV